MEYQDQDNLSQFDVVAAVVAVVAVVAVAVAAVDDGLRALAKVDTPRAAPAVTAELVRRPAFLGLFVDVAARTVPVRIT